MPRPKYESQFEGEGPHVVLLALLAHMVKYFGHKPQFEATIYEYDTLASFYRPPAINGVEFLACKIDVCSDQKEEQDQRILDCNTSNLAACDPVAILPLWPVASGKWQSLLTVDCKDFSQDMHQQAVGFDTACCTAEEQSSSATACKLLSYNS
ncbi:hypothetical protein ACLKA6_006085 [Drosophila palustris]